MINDVEKVLLSEEQLSQKIAELGEEISKDYQGKEIVAICVLKGAILFMADLARAVKVPMALDFMAVSSYGNGTSTSGTVRILKDLDNTPCIGLLTKKGLKSDSSSKYFIIPGSIAVLFV